MTIALRHPSFHVHEVLHWRPDKKERLMHHLVAEAPLSIEIQGVSFSAGMRTPGDEAALAAGFCLSQGVIASPEDIESISVSGPLQPDRVSVTLTRERWNAVKSSVERRGEKEGASWGLTAEEVVIRMVDALTPFQNGGPIDIREGLRCLEQLNRHQPLRDETRATHATAVFTHRYELLTIKEDVGRHNGMDKAIGRLLLDRRLEKAGFLALSSRISFELVQKAARAHIPILLSVSRPSALAVKMAVSLNMTVACLARSGGCFVFCGGHRLNLESS